MKSIPSTVVSGRQLFKVVTITLHRSHQMIESDSDEACGVGRSAS